MASLSVRINCHIAYTPSYVNNRSILIRGAHIVGFGIQFMTNAGLGDEDAFNLGVVQNCVGLLGCVIAWWIMTNVGRRRLYMSGLSGIFVILMIVGFLGIAPDSNKSASWAVGVLIVLMLLVFQVQSLTPSNYRPKHIDNLQNSCP